MENWYFEAAGEGARTPISGSESGSKNEAQKTKPPPQALTCGGG
jgi:hypothetical protein